MRVSGIRRNKEKVAESSKNDVAAWGNNPTVLPNAPKGFRMGAVLSWVGYESWPENGSREYVTRLQPKRYGIINL